MLLPASTSPRPARASPGCTRWAFSRKRAAIEELKHDVVTQTLEETGGNWAEAARRLGMDRSNLHHMARRLGMPVGR